MIYDLKSEIYIHQKGDQKIKIKIINSFTTFHLVFDALHAVYYFLKFSHTTLLSMVPTPSE